MEAISALLALAVKLYDRYQTGQEEDRTAAEAEAKAANEGATSARERAYAERDRLRAETDEAIKPSPLGDNPKAPPSDPK